MLLMLTIHMFTLHILCISQIYKLFTAELAFDAKRLKHAMDFVAQAIDNKSKDPQSQFNETIDYVNTQVYASVCTSCSVLYLAARNYVITQCQ
jgi:hypothetical protein